MRETLLFFGYMLACLLIASVLSYPLIHGGLLDEDPRRILGRAAQVLMLVGVWPFLHWLGLDRRALLGFAQPRRTFVRYAGLGWLLGSLMMSLIVGGLVMTGARVIEEWLPGSAIHVLEAALGALVAGALIATIEETFFRGALFSFIRRRHSLTTAAVWSALLYALVHFMKPHDPPLELGTDWAAIGWMLQSVFTGLLEWEHLDSLVALWFAGVLLALLRERTGSIAMGIGMHAGWVFMIKIGRQLTDGTDTSAWSWLAGHYDGVIGWLAVAVIVPAIVVERFTAPPRTPTSAERHSRQTNV